MPVKTNLQQWRRNLTATQKATQATIRAATPGVAREVRDLIRKRIPPGASSQGMTNPFPGYAAKGNLKSAIVAGPVRERGKSFAAKVGVGASVSGLTRRIARAHEHGMTIRAKNAPYLRFRVGDKWVRVKSVQIKPKHFFRAGWAEAKQRFPEFVGKYVRQRFPQGR